MTYYTVRVASKREHTRDFYLARNLGRHSSPSSARANQWHAVERKTIKGARSYADRWARFAMIGVSHEPWVVEIVEVNGDERRWLLRIDY